MANSYDKRSDFNFGIDDIYDDEMYGDDKLDQVLDEIAEIKKTIQGLPEAESYDGGYDEVTKLRDEVRFSKTTQKLQDDIRRLNNRINDLTEERFGEDPPILTILPIHRNHRRPASGLHRFRGKLCYFP